MGGLERTTGRSGGGGTSIGESFADAVGEERGVGDRDDRGCTSQGRN